MTYKKNDMIEKLIHLRLKEGYSKHSLLEYCKNTFNKSYAYGYQLIAEAEKEIQKFKWNTYSEDIELEIARLEEVYQLAMNEETRNLFIAKDTLKEINKLKGLYIDRQEVKLSGDISVIKLTKAIKSEED